MKKFILYECKLVKLLNSIQFVLLSCTYQLTNVVWSSSNEGELLSNIKLLFFLNNIINVIDFIILALFYLKIFGLVLKEVGETKFI